MVNVYGIADNEKTTLYLEQYENILGVIKEIIISQKNMLVPHK